ncbi:hypothetical protein [Pseudomonas donghuensis]|uniref:Uncharacterized protein n=1 Tax=Pseudomonas donghuensis TaxID=1163398 RepID=A0AAP0XDC9_9PSED|nr:hypothetical protein [Pseudomonas donghuensis]MDF9894146.1 hypothetical protein [Pseudomonas vranovensis]KDN98562.2 hypothetical protein BV82_3569 [Pseudomonas donghuensis]MBF4211061.1 hypothetical protein [Pseudomonas donghuensis]MCP6693627.1 hypothetical protein [Pseudomonas donghuensis]MCP6699530.1 hypothetical protein [Pseudomonas donghuensis]
MTRTPSAVFPPPPAMTATSGTLQPGFYIVPHSMTGAQVLALLTAQQGPQLIARLQRLNPTFASGFKAGEIFVVGDPDITSACTREEAELMTAAAQVRESLAALSAEEANFMMRHQAEIAGLSAGASQAMGVGKDMLEKGLRQVEATLRSIEQLHQREFSRSGRLNSPDFFNARRRLYLQLDAQLKSAFLNKQMNLGSYDSLRKNLGISTRSLVHHWSRAGGAGQIPGYATHLDQVAKTAKYLKYGGYVGIGLGGTASWLTVRDACRVGETDECRKVRFTATGSFAGGLAGGAVGAYFGTQAALSVCVAFGPLGAAVCVIVIVGTGSLIGGYGGGLFGERMGEMIYEARL